MEIPAKYTRAELYGAIAKVRAEADKVRARGWRGDAELAHRLEAAANKISAEADKRQTAPIQPG